MYKIYVGNTLVVCETPEEVTALTNHLERGKAAPVSGPASKGLIQQAMQAISASSPATHMTNFEKMEKEEIDKFIREIKKFRNTLVTSEDLARVLGVGSVHGVGPRMSAMSKRFERVYSLPLDNILEREGRPGQPTVWKVNSSVLDNVDMFQ